MLDRTYVKCCFGNPKIFPYQSSAREQRQCEADKRRIAQSQSVTAFRSYNLGFQFPFLSGRNTVDSKALTEYACALIGQLSPIVLSISIANRRLRAFESKVFTLDRESLVSRKNPRDTRAADNSALSLFSPRGLFASLKLIVSNLTA